MTGTGVQQWTVLHGHTSPETAYVVDSYPYGAQLRCRKRYWVETSAKGQYKNQQRLMGQTTNPKRGDVWNKPHNDSVFHPFLLMYRDESNQHVHCWGTGGYTGVSGADNARIKLSGAYGQFTDDQRAAYDLWVKVGQVRDGWGSWHKALSFIRDHADQHEGEMPEPVAVMNAPGFYLDEADYDIAVAAAVHLPFG